MPVEGVCYQASVAKGEGMTRDELIFVLLCLIIVTVCMGVIILTPM